jgi:hypothetical protein
MSAPKKGSQSPAESHDAPNLARVISAVVFGIAFGFLLQKGGVAKYNVLIGQLLLQDFTVMKIMMTAVAVGMPGIFLLNNMAKVNLHIEPTRLGAQAIGGLLFGAGFALLAYCPGTGAAALGQGSWDALFGMAGLVAGSYVFAELSGWLKQSVQTWGDLGKVTLPDLCRLPRLPFALVTTAVLLLALYFLHRAFPA